MTEIYTTGRWKPKAESEDAFIAAWSAFAAWASGMPDAGTLRLARDVRDPERFLSFGDWKSIDAVREWKGSSEFRERMAQIQEHVDEFEPTELAVVAKAEDGKVVSSPVGKIEPAHSV